MAKEKALLFSSATLEATFIMCRSFTPLNPHSHTQKSFLVTMSFAELAFVYLKLQTAVLGSS